MNSLAQCKFTDEVSKINLNNEMYLYTFNRDRFGILIEKNVLEDKKGQTNIFVLGKTKITLDNKIFLNQYKHKQIKAFQIIFYRFLISNGASKSEIPEFLKLKYLVVPLKYLKSTGSVKIDYFYIEKLLNFNLEELTPENIDKNGGRLLWDKNENLFSVFSTFCTFSYNDQLKDFSMVHEVAKIISTGVRSDITFKEYYEDLYQCKLDLSYPKPFFFGYNPLTIMYKQISSHFVYENITPSTSKYIPNYNKGNCLIMLSQFNSITDILESFISDWIDFYFNFSIFTILYNNSLFNINPLLSNLDIISNDVHPNNNILLSSLIQGETNLMASFLGSNVIKFVLTNYLTLMVIKEHCCKSDKDFTDWPTSIVGEVVQLKEDLLKLENLSLLLRNAKLDQFTIFNSIFNYFYIPQIDNIPHLPALEDLIPDNSLFSPDDWESPFEFLFVKPSGNKLNLIYGHIYSSIVFQLYSQSGLGGVLKYFYNTKLLDMPTNAVNCNACGHLMHVMTRESATSSSIYPFKNYFLDIEYDKILNELDIASIEGIINYHFKNKALIEKAFVHSSAAKGKFNVEYFQVMELVGDSFLDLVVCDFLSFTENANDPDSLFREKEKLVNNDALGSLVKGTGLANYFMADPSIKFKPKHYGDICEALIGAIFADLKLDYNKAKEYFMANFFYLTVKYKSKN